MIRSLVKRFFTLRPKVDLHGLLRDGAVVVDVRTHAEFSAGHVPGAINVPLDGMLRDLHRIPKNAALVVCCATGRRSSIAVGILEAHGRQAFNGGSWQAVRNALVNVSNTGQVW